MKTLAERAIEAYWEKIRADRRKVEGFEEAVISLRELLEYGGEDGRLSLLPGLLKDGSIVFDGFVFQKIDGAWSARLQSPTGTLRWFRIDHLSSLGHPLANEWRPYEPLAREFDSIPFILPETIDQLNALTPQLDEGAQ